MRYSSGMSKLVFLERPRLCPLIQIRNLLLSPSHILQAESYFAIKWWLEKHNCNAYHQLSREPLEVCGWTCLCWSDIGCLMKEAHILVNRDSSHLNNHELLSTTCIIVNCTWGHAQVQTTAGTQKLVPMLGRYSRRGQLPAESLLRLSPWRWTVPGKGWESNWHGLGNAWTPY